MEENTQTELNPAAEVPAATPTETVEETPEVKENWDAADIFAKLNDEAPEAAVSQDEGVEKDPPAPFPAESAEVKEQEVIEEPDIAEVTAAEGNPFKLNRKELREVENKVITPLRNPDVPITEALNALEQFHPTRLQELKQHVVNESAKQFPDDWVAALTGIDGLTVERVKELHSRGDTPAPPEQDDNKEITQELTELYGENWRDPAHDHELLDDDRKLVKALRRQLELEEKVNAGDTELRAKLDKANDELNALKPKVDEIEQKQREEFEQKVQDTLKASVTEYRSAVEQKALPKLFAEAGILPTEQDTDSVKNMKNYIKSRFEPAFGDSSDFDMFVIQEFSGRENVQKIAQRVSTNLAQAAKLEAQNTPQTKPQAAALRAQANMEQDAITVLTRQAAQEFLKSPHMTALMAVIEENADLQRRLSQGGRREIIGSTVNASNADAWKEGLKGEDGSWNTNILSERLSQSAR